MNRPEYIHHVSQTQLSIARHYGGCTFNGADYHYDAENDRLIRMDIYKAMKASDKKGALLAAREERAKWRKAAEEQQSFVGW